MNNHAISTNSNNINTNTSGVSNNNTIVTNGGVNTNAYLVAGGGVSGYGGDDEFGMGLMHEGRSFEYNMKDLDYDIG